MSLKGSHIFVGGLLIFLSQRLLRFSLFKVYYIEDNRPLKKHVASFFLKCEANPKSTASGSFNSWLLYCFIFPV
jgi:hypothetical protein